MLSNMNSLHHYISRVIARLLVVVVAQTRNRRVWEGKDRYFLAEAMKHLPHKKHTEFYFPSAYRYDNNSEWVTFDDTTILLSADNTRFIIPFIKKEITTSNSAP